MKLGVQPDRVLQSMLNDRMVAKGLILQYATAFFQDYLSSESIDDLVALLRKARLDTHLLDLFPPQKRTLKDLDEHFKVRGSSPLLVLPSLTPKATLQGPEPQQHLVNSAWRPQVGCATLVANSTNRNLGQQATLKEVHAARREWGTQVTALVKVL